MIYNYLEMVQPISKVVFTKLKDAYLIFRQLQKKKKKKGASPPKKKILDTSGPPMNLVLILV